MLTFATLLGQGVRATPINRYIRPSATGRDVGGLTMMTVGFVLVLGAASASLFVPATTILMIAFAFGALLMEAGRRVSRRRERNAGKSPRRPDADPAGAAADIDTTSRK